ncbi:MAG: M28 family peptidase [Planctomycetota bacterium]
MIAALERAFDDAGLETERHYFYAVLPEPVDAEVTVLANPERGEPVVSFPLRETPPDGDPYAGDPRHVPGFNAFSGSGTVESGIVYANRALTRDFEKLAEMGVEIEGKIVVARYGGSYRGDKARLAELHGAAGLILFLDPASAGRGPQWPAGGWSNGTSIQRGSIKTLPWAGDPLTPFVEATRDAERLDISEVALPTIPVQPIGWDSAREIVARMTGPSVDELGLDGWATGLEAVTRVEGGDSLRVRLRVEQTRDIRRSANVLGTMVGASEPDRMIVVGSHHDAWGFGASDPASGLITVVDAARVLNERVASGELPPPRRSIVFAGWGAEEYGLIGSTEWVEGRLGALQRGAVAYLNLDMAAVGPNMAAAATPSLRRAVIDGASGARAAGRSETIADAGMTSRGELGGGSDFVPFLCHAGVPSVAMVARGSEGSAYHTEFDHLAWYRSTVGDDYESARMVRDAAVGVIERLAWDPLIPVHPADTARSAAKAIQAIAADHDEALDAAMRLEAAASAIESARARAEEALAAGSLTDDDLDRVNEMLLGATRAWTDPEGLAGRPWYRHLYASPDPETGYGAWTIPGLRGALHAGDAEAIAHESARLVGVAERIEAAAAEILSLFSDS